MEPTLPQGGPVGAKCFDESDLPFDARPVIVIVGPTASGKSACAIEVAKRLGGEVISADSMQVYRGMDIGTGKVPPSERRVPHWGLDLVDPGQPYSAALFQAYARERISDIFSRGKVPILCGGTGFYVRAVIDDYQFPAGEQLDNPVRESYNRMLEERGALALWQELQRLDPESAQVIHPNNSKRVVRALELLEAGESYSRQKEALSDIGEAIPALQFGLSVERKVLYDRIDRRVEDMVAEGLVGEVEGLLSAGFREGLCAPQAIGYKEVVAALEGRCSLDEAMAAVQQASRRYAKRQISWFKRDRRIYWIEATYCSAEQIAGLIVEKVRGLAV